MAKTNLLRELTELVQRADRYDDEARMALLGYCDTHPEVWEEFQAVVARIQAELTQFVAGDDPALTAEIIQGLARVRAQLAGQDPMPIERAIVDLVALRWLQWHHAESLCEQHKGSFWRSRELLARREAQCRRCYQAGLYFLAKVRRLLETHLNTPAPAQTSAGAG